MADKKNQWRRIIDGRKARGEHYMTIEKFKAQMEFMKSVAESNKKEEDKERGGS